MVIRPSVLSSDLCCHSSTSEKWLCTDAILLETLYLKASLADMVLWPALSTGFCLEKPCLYRRSGKLEKYEIVPGRMLYVRLCTLAYACL